MVKKQKSKPGFLDQTCLTFERHVCRFIIVALCCTSLINLIKNTISLDICMSCQFFFFFFFLGILPNVPWGTKRAGCVVRYAMLFSPFVEVLCWSAYLFGFSVDQCFLWRLCLVVTYSSLWPFGGIYEYSKTSNRQAGWMNVLVDCACLVIRWIRRR